MESTYLLGNELFEPRKVNGCRIIPVEGHITNITFGEKQLSTVLVNGEVKDLPALVRAGDLLKLNDGDIALIKTTNTLTP